MPAFDRKQTRTDAVSPTVSVVVPCKNDARFLISNLESILSQDYPLLECIVVDGGSSDATPELLKRYGDRIRWVSEPDRGAFDAINRGWSMSSGQILAWLNADDLWQPGAVRSVVHEFETRPGVDVLYGTSGVIDELGRIHGDLVPRQWDLEDALRSCDHIIFQPAAFIRREILERVGWLYPAWCHDHDLWLRIALAGGTFAQIPTRLAMDRVRLDNLGQVAETVVPAKIQLTKRFFAAQGLPPSVKRLRRRALSGAYLRGLDYLRRDRPGHALWGAALLLRAFVADPGNIQEIGERLRKPVHRVGSGLRSHAGRLLATTRRAAVRVVMSPVTAPRRVMKNMVESIFRIGNRRVEQRIDQVGNSLKLTQRHNERRLGRVEKTVRRAVDRLARRTDCLASDLSQLAPNIEMGRQEIRDALDVTSRRHDAIERAIPVALQPISDRLERLAADISQLARGLDERGRDMNDALHTLSRHHEARVEELEQAIPKALQPLSVRIEALSVEVQAARERPTGSLTGSLCDVYGTLPALRPVPGWHTGCVIDDKSGPLLRRRAEQWASLKTPVLMRWLADLLVKIWPGNELSRVLFLTGNFEPNELTWMTKTLTEGMTMIDVGAHMGMYSLIGSKLVGDSGTVIAMEPSSREFQRLMFHVALNDLNNVRCLHEAASDAVGEATLKIAAEWNSGHNTFGEFFDASVEQAGEERVRRQTVDAVVAAQALTRVDLIKVDVEGHELRVLSGATETLARFRPNILIEAFESTLRAQGTGVETLVAFLKQRRYSLYEFSDTTGELVPLSRSVGSQSRNLVARPATAVN